MSRMSHPIGMVGHHLAHFHSWRDLLAYARTGAPLFYQAPLDYRPTRLYPKTREGQELAYEVRARSIRIWPPGSTGRGRRRTSDPFTADAGHLSRFRHPAEEPFVQMDPRRLDPARRPKLTAVHKIPPYAVIIRAIHERGKTQKEALAELDRRGLWLSPEQRRQAGLAVATTGRSDPRRRRR